MNPCYLVGEWYPNFNTGSLVSSRFQPHTHLSAKIATSLTQKGITPILQIRVIPHNSSEGGSMNYEMEFGCYSAIVCIEETLQEIESIMAADLSVAVRTVSSGIDALKKLTDLAVKTQNIELQEGILELRSQLLEIKESLLEVKEENFNLREENKGLKQKVVELETQTQGKLILKESVYYTESGDGPFCTGCFDNNQKMIRVSELSGNFRLLGKYKCPVCGAKYSGE